MVPSSLTNRNMSPLNAPAPAPLLKTCPVGFPAPPGGITTPPDGSGGDPNVTLLATLVVGLTEYKVETPVPLSETQNGLAPEVEMPQGLTRNGSVSWAGLSVWSLVTRFVTLKTVSALAGATIPIWTSVP